MKYISTLIKKFSKMPVRKQKRSIHKKTGTRKQNQNSSNTLFTLLGYFFALLGLFLWLRIGYLQLIWVDFLAPRAKRQQTALEYIPGKRGDIVDRNNRILARSVEMQTISIQPALIENLYTTSEELGRLLQKPALEIQKAIENATGTILIARKVSDTIARSVAQAELPGVSIITEYGRVYPNKDVAGILLGFVGDDGIGLEGIEYITNAELTGKSQKNVLLRDARGKKLFVANNPENEDIEGKKITLTIDMHVQYIAEEALVKTIQKYNAKWGGALVVEVKTGDILAWAEAPRFNPNSFQSYTASQWKNRLATDAYEPGSSFKIFPLAIALEENIVRPESIIFCEGGSWNIGKTTITDDRRSYQWLPLTKVFAYSSNIGMAKIGLSLGIKKYQDYLQKLGFGAITELPLPQSPGITRANRFWSDVDIATLAFGQGISVTGVQLAQASLVIANGGFFQPLRIFKNAPIEAYQYRIFSEQTIANVRSMLRDVVENGTGKRAYIPNLDIGGKTGTAEKADLTGGGYGTKRSASFIGMFPIDKPQYLIIVLIDEPTKNVYGGVVATEAFKMIASQFAVYKELGVANNTVVPKNSNEKNIHNIRKPVLPAKISPTIIPNLQGMSLRKAFETLTQFNIVPTIYGKAGVVIKQSPPPGTPVKEKSDFTLWLSSSEK